MSKVALLPVGLTILNRSMDKMNRYTPYPGEGCCIGFAAHHRKKLATEMATHIFNLILGEQSKIVVQTQCMMSPGQTHKEVQPLTGFLAALKTHLRAEKKWN
uniref:Uncharacterized protein n=1 Tax=Arion vulgaris TaxID=1028688 RepID=A0A0B7AJZ6_9EUPU